MEKTQANIRINELRGIIDDANRRYYVEHLTPRHKRSEAI